ncbi:MAG: LLM class F420-dependent oxidoreductase [Aeromicrobium sp.]
MPRLKLAISLGTDLAALRTNARAYEDAGADIILVPESYGADAVSTLGYLAATTERVELMSAILPIYSRTPTLLAMTAAGIDSLSDGRFTLGIGASGAQVVEGWHGVPFDAPVGRTREVIDICRSVWRRDRVEHSGRRYAIPLPPDRGTGLGRPLKLIHQPVRPVIPVYVAALGAATVQLAAEVADGWIPHLYVAERAARVWADPLAAGAAKRDAALGPLGIVAGGPMAIGRDVTDLREDDRAHLALYIGGMGARNANFYNRLIAQYGWEADAERIQDLYLDGHTREAAAAIPPEILEATSFIGDEHYIRDRLAACLDQGVTVVQATPAGPDPLGDIRRMADILHSL